MRIAVFFEMAVKETGGAGLRRTGDVGEPGAGRGA